MAAIKLIPFGREMAKFFEVTSSVKRDNMTIDISYKVSGDIKRLHLPKRNSPQPQRMGGLWETTCFELFIKNKRTNSYLELNLAPTGNWNCFHFDDYRMGMTEFNGLERIDITFNKVDSYLILSAKIEIKEQRYFQIEDFNDGDVKAAVAVVLENTQNVKSYWAPKHYESRPDFHTEENFSITL